MITGCTENRILLSGCIFRGRTDDPALTLRSVEVDMKTALEVYFRTQRMQNTPAWGLLCARILNTYRSSNPVHCIAQGKRRM